MRLTCVPSVFLPPAVFSYGYGEDDDKEGDKLALQLDGKTLVAGADAAIIGMQPGGRRRVLVRPERGWRLLTGACADGEKTLDLTAAKRTSATDGGNLVFKAPIAMTFHLHLHPNCQPAFGGCHRSSSVPNPNPSPVLLTPNSASKADIGAAIDNVDACQNKVSLPQPRTYGQKQRFARRFDESLMMEIDLVAFSTTETARKWHE